MHLSAEVVAVLVQVLGNALFKALVCVPVEEHFQHAKEQTWKCQWKLWLAWTFHSGELSRWCIVVTANMATWMEHELQATKPRIVGIPRRPLLWPQRCWDVTQTHAGPRSKSRTRVEFILMGGKDHNHNRFDASHGDGNAISELETGTNAAKNLYDQARSLR